MSWMEKLDLTVMPDGALNSIYAEKFNAYLTALQGGENAEVLAACSIQEKFRAEIERRNSAMPSSGTYENALQLRAMQNWFTESCPKFGPAVDVALFIQSLDNGYKLFVQSSPSMEQSFIQLAVSKMCGDYSTTFTNSADFTNCARSYQKFIKYLKDNYASRETIFQILSSLWEIERRESEDIHSLGIRFEEKAREISTRIQSKYADTAESEKLKKKILNAEDVFLLVGSMQLFNHIREKEPETYKLLLKDCDSCLTPSGLSKKAKLYTDRLIKSEPSSLTYAARMSRPRKDAKSECHNFRRNGVCPRDDECPYYHDARRLQIKPCDSSEDESETSEESEDDGDVNIAAPAAQSLTAVRSRDESPVTYNADEVFYNGV